MAGHRMERWRNKVALVTGASSGIGAATAQRLAGLGMRVALWARRADRLRTVARQIEDRKGQALIGTVDMRDEAAIAEGFARLRNAWGGVDVLINNAGLGHNAPLMSGETEHWREMLEVNVLGLCICTREAVSDMRDRGNAGHVIHISSMAAHRVPPGSGVYSASKYAVRALTEGLRQELRAVGSDIRVTEISPGFVETEFAEVYHKSSEVARETYSRFKVLEPNDVADSVVHVLAAPAHVQVHDVLLRPTHQPG